MKTQNAKIKVQSDLMDGKASKKSTIDFGVYFFSSNGNAIVLAIVVSAVLLIVMLVGIMLIRQQTHLISGSRRKSEALSVAEAGLDAAIWRLERNQQLADGSSFFGYNSGGRYTVTVDMPQSDLGNTFYYVIKSVGEHTDTGVKKAVQQDVYYINLSRSVYSYSGTSGGGQTEGSVNIRGPFYTSGDLNLNGNVGIYNLDNTTGNPLMIRGNLIIGSAGVNIGGNTAQTGQNSPMAVFVKGTIDRPGQVHTLKSKQVPEVTLPDIVSSQYLDAAQGNDSAVYSGDLTLGTDTVQFGQRSDGSYTFNYNGSTTPATLTTEGAVYIDGSLTTNKRINYQHGSYQGTNYTKSTIFVNGKITINKEIRSLGTYPANSVLALINEDIPDPNDPSDVYIDVASGASNPPLVQSFIYTGGRITINKKVKVQGSVMAYMLWLNQVPDLEAPPDSVINNYPYLFPGRDLAFITTSNWREVSTQ